jgi:uncharacterized membrane protein HdeD (DUF308 family)
MIWRQWPLASLWLIGLFVGMDLLVYGGWLIAMAMVVRDLPNRLGGSNEIGA